MAQLANEEQPDNDDNKEDNEPLTGSAQILADREQWEQIKKALDAVMPTIDQIIRIADAGNKPNKLKKMKKKKTKQLNEFKAKLSGLPKDNELIISGMDIAEKLSVDLDAQALGNLNFEVRRFTQSIVKIRRDLMQKYKEVKKEEEGNA